MSHHNHSVFMAGALPGQIPARHLQVPEGLCVSDIVSRVHPREDAARERFRVHLVSDRGEILVEPHLWPHVKPKPGVNTRIVAVPGGDEIRQVLTIVVSVAAIALTGPVAGALGITGQFGLGLVTAGLTVVGALLVDALIPIQVPNAGSASDARRNVYSIQGWRNDARPGESLPSIMGALRYSPPFAATSYTEIVEDQQYVRALFTPGYGPVRVSDLRIGDTPIDEFKDIEVEIREGRDADMPVSLYSRQVLEDAAGIELIRPYPRDTAGEIIDGAASVSTPVTRFTAGDSAQASVILSFPQGLFRVDDDGDVKTQSVSVQIRQRLDGVGAWSTVETLEISASKREAIFKQHSWDLPSRGRWQIEVERLSDEPTETDRSDRVTLAAVQSIRPEYPINMEIPIALIAVRVRATYQLNGSVDNLNCLVERQGSIRSAGEWAVGYGRNPATAFLTVLRGAENPYPADDADIDLDLIAEWYDYCVAKDLKYDFAHDEGAPLGDMLMAICGAGRATARHDGVQWGVVVDRSDGPVIEHFNDQNADQFTWTQPYFDPPDGFRVRFLDETVDYRPAERIVPWPGFVGDPVLTEEISLPGKTDPAEVYREARRRMYELIHRPTSYAAMTSMRTRVATRGDLVMASFNEINETHYSARVRQVTGNLVVLDSLIEAGVGRGMRFKSFAADDIVGASVVRAVADATEDTTALRLTGNGEVPEVDQIVHIGPISADSVPLRIRAIEPADDFNSRMLFVPHAPEIDQLTDDLVVPAWDGRVGTDVGDLLGPPAAPVFRYIRSGSGSVFGASANSLAVGVGPGSGSAAFLNKYRVRHRIVGTTPWTTDEFPAANGAFFTDIYLDGDNVEMEAEAFSTVWGPASSLRSHIIGTQNPVSSDPLDDDDITVTGSLGHTDVAVFLSNTFVSSGGAERRPTQIQVFRVPDGDVLDRATDAVSGLLSVTSGQTTNFVDGDPGRSNIATGSGLTRSFSTSNGKILRISFVVSGRTAGTVTPKLIGGTEVPGAAVDANGQALVSLVANGGTNGIEFEVDVAFDGVIDDVVVFEETASCIPSGEWDYYIEPFNQAGNTGQVSGPFSVTVI